jgi:hypothetical protein
METNSHDAEIDKNPSASFKTTPLSKYLTIALFILLPFVGVYVGYRYMPERVVGTESSPKEGGELVQSANVIEANVPAEYLSSVYRVVHVVKNPYYSKESKYDSLVIASLRGVNDDSCGGAYYSSHCYLFLESTYYGIETPKFVGIWNGGFSSLRPETVKFISPTVIEFNASGGDAGYSIKTKWHLDVITASSSMVSKEEEHSEDQ